MSDAKAKIEQTRRDFMLSASALAWPVLTWPTPDSIPQWPTN